MLIETEKRIDGEHVSSIRFYQSKLFKEVCKELGIPWGMPTTNLTIELNIADDTVRITHEYDGHKAESNVEVETTNMHNETCRSFRPREGFDD